MACGDVKKLGVPDYCRTCPKYYEQEERIEYLERRVWEAEKDKGRLERAVGEINDIFGDPEKHPCRHKVQEDITDCPIENVIKGLSFPEGRKPKVVTLCGSTRFRLAFLEWNARLTLEERAVVFTVSTQSRVSAEEKAKLGQLHLAKIDVSDEIFVLDVGGYIGKGTQRAIRHAMNLGKRVRYLSAENPGWAEDDCLYARPPRARWPEVERAAAKLEHAWTTGHDEGDAEYRSCLEDLLAHVRRRRAEERQQAERGTA